MIEYNKFDDKDEYHKDEFTKELFDKYGDEDEVVKYNKLESKEMGVLFGCAFAVATGPAVVITEATSPYIGGLLVEIPRKKKEEELEMGDDE